MEYKTKFSYIIDFIFKVVSIFLISFIWIRLFEHNLTLIIIYSALITLVLSLISTIISVKKIKKENLSNEENLNFKNAIYKLNFYSKPQLLTFFNNMIKNKFKTTKNTDFILLENDNKKIGLFFNFNFETTDKNFISLIYRKIKVNKLNKVLIFSNDFTKETKELCENFKDIKFSLLNASDTYKFMKKYNSLPSNEIEQVKKTKYKFKDFLYIAFNKSKTKRYFFTGIIFLISSIFMRYNIYYLVFTTLMFLFAMFSFFNKPFNKKTDGGYFN